MEKIIVPGSIFVLIILWCVWVIMTSRKNAKIWNVVAEGDFSFVVYGSYEYTHRSGAMVHHSDTYIMEITVIYFSDGRTHLLHGRRDMIYPSGTRLRILRNRNGAEKIEAVK